MKYREILEGLLLEIDMSPSYLKAEAQTIDARAGMEFEMIVPDVSGGDDDDDEDYRDDERARSWSDVETFFEDDNDLRSLNRAYQALWNEYENDSDAWSHLLDDAWDENGEDLVRQEIESDLEDELYDEARELKKQGDQRELDLIYSDLLDDRVSESMNNQDEYYERARDESNGDVNIADGFDDWISRVYGNMSDVHSWLMNEGEDLTWPGSDSGDGSGDSIADVALDFMKALNYDTVAYSDSYHGQYSKWDSGTGQWRSVGSSKPTDCFTVEPDGSLNPNNSKSERGLEFVAPPMPLDQTLSDLQKVKAWADSRGCYTSKKNRTGLHINVSVPNVGEKNENIDYVKLALLLGDKYVLEEFERLGETYAASALDLVATQIKSKPAAVNDLLAKMKEGMSKIAKHSIQSSEARSVNKYTSIHPKTGYIEFRSPGGDWLDANFDKIENTLMRFVVALDASIDESKHAEEYAKKLYKFIDPKNQKMDDDTVAKFVQYSTKGYSGITGAGLSKAVRDDLMLQAKQYRAKNPATQGEMDEYKQRAEKYYENNPIPPNMTKEEAVEERTQLESILDVYNRVMLPKYALKSDIRQSQFKRAVAKGKFPKGVKAWYAVHMAGKGARNGSIYQVVADSPENALELVAKETNYRDVDQLKYNNPSVEVELKGPYSAPVSKSSEPNYEIYNKVTGLGVEKFYAKDDEAAIEFLDQYRAMGPHPFSVEQARQRFGTRRLSAGTLRPSEPSRPAWIPPEPPDTSTGAFSQDGSYAVISSSTALPLGRYNTEQEAFAAAREFASQRDERVLVRYGLGTTPVEPNEQPRRQDGSMTAPESNPDANYAIMRSSDNAVIVYFTRNTRAEAERSFTQWLASQGLAGATTHPYYLIAIRPRRDAESRANDVAVANQPSGRWTGRWKIVSPEGQVIHTFGGIGNAQSDANRVAIEWLRQNPRHMQSGVEVVPEME